MAAGDIIRLQFDQSIFGDQVQNILWYEVVTDDGGVDNEDAIADAFNLAVIPAWQPCVTNQLSMDCLGTQKMFPVPLSAFREKFLLAVGTAVGTALPIVTNALLQKFNPIISGRGRKGHVNITGISEDDSDEGRINSALNILLETLVTALTANLLSPGGGDYKPVWATFTKVAPIVVDGAVDWVRSVVLPRLSHIGTRKTPIRKLAP